MKHGSRRSCQAVEAAPLGIPRKIRTDAVLRMELVQLAAASESCALQGRQNLTDLRGEVGEGLLAPRRRLVSGIVDPSVFELAAVERKCQIVAAALAPPWTLEGVLRAFRVRVTVTPIFQLALLGHAAGFPQGHAELLRVAAQAGADQVPPRALGQTQQGAKAGITPQRRVGHTRLNHSTRARPASNRRLKRWRACAIAAENKA
mmetsp:Transcript_46529/g.141222  ORF Transcript_46529/g.141222 Transcript_46529/m.141222 type:complete len:204 (-) Transcript_46529:17-628(-)